MSSSLLRICVAGAGAIGCILAARIALSGQTVNVFARGQTLAAIQRQGIHLTDLEGHYQVDVNASDNAEHFGVQDLLFLCVKAHSLPDLLANIQPLIGPETVVVPVVNGVPWWYFHGEGGRFDGQRVEAVDSAGILSAALELAQVIGCVVYITAQCPTPAVVESNNPYRIILGEPGNCLSPRLERVRQVIEAAGIEAHCTDRIRDQLWTKIIANLTSNPVSVITGATLEQIYGLPAMRELAISTFHEALLTAAAYGARVAMDPHTFMEFGTSMGAVRTSMRQDFDKGLPLELAAIGDAVLELADRMLVSMPITRAIITLARFRGEQASQ